MKKLKKLAGLLLATSLVLTACGGQQNKNDKENNQTAAESETIKIGSMGPLTGGAAVYGVSSTNGAKLAVEEINAQGGINGKKIEYILHDDKNDTNEAIHIYDLLAEEKVVAILGAITSAPSEAVAARAKEDNLLMITPSGTQFGITSNRPNVFRVCYTDPFQGQILAQYASESGKKTVALMKNTSSEYSSGVYEAFKEKAKELGLEIVAEESYGNADKDFRVQLTNIAAKKPEILLVPDYYEVNALILSQAREIGIDALILGPDGWDGIVTQVEKSNQALLENVVFANHYSIDDKSEKIQNFLKNYREKFNEEPTAFSALAYDGIYMIKSAIENAKSTDKQAVIDAMKAINYEGITGKLSFDENNNPIKEVSMIKIENGEYKLDKLVKSK
ncbi:ABC transporter substrate-binding protein [Peptoniphilaceae bacterium SGI.131]